MEKKELSVQERRKEVKRRVENGETTPQIAEAINVSEKTVKNDREFLKKQGLLNPLNTEENIEKRRKEVERRVENGETTPEIAKALNVSQKTVQKDRKFLTEQGLLNSLNTKESIEERRKEVKRRVENGETTPQIAKAMDVSEKTVKNDREFLIKQGLVNPLNTEENIEKRRKEVERRVENGETTPEIARALNVSETTIKEDRRFLTKQKRMIRKIVKSNVILKRTEEQIQAEIKEKLNLEVSIETIYSDILYLESKGEIEKTKEEKLVIPRRREIVKIMYNNEKSRKEIFERLQELGFNVALEVVDSDIKMLKKQGQITAKSAKEIRAERIQKRRKIIKREYNTIEGGKRKTREEIQEIVQQEMNMKIPLKLISKDIAYLRKQGQLINKRKTKQEKRREIVKNGIINQKTEQQIQQEIREKMKIEVSLEKIGDDINYLEIEGEIEPKDENIIIRKRREVELYKQDTTVEEIQETIKKEFNIKLSLAVIYRDIRPYIKLEKEEKLAIRMPHKELRRIAKMVGKEFYGQANLIMVLKRYMSSCKIRFENNVLKTEDLPVIKESAILMQNYQDIAFYLKVAVSEEKFEEALDVINGQIGNEVFTKQEEKAIKSLQEKMKVLVKNNRAKQMLEKGFSVEETVKSTGVLETKVMEINRKLIEEKQNRQRGLEENDDGDEQELA